MKCRYEKKKIFLRQKWMGGSPQLQQLAWIVQSSLRSQARTSLLLMSGCRKLTNKECLACYPPAGVSMMQDPFDLLVIQNIIYDLQPDLIIETGTANGGSSLLWASVLEVLGLHNTRQAPHFAVGQPGVLAMLRSRLASPGHGARAEIGESSRTCKAPPPRHPLSLCCACRPWRPHAFTSLRVCPDARPACWHLCNLAGYTPSTCTTPQWALAPAMQ